MNEGSDERNEHDERDEAARRAGVELERLLIDRGALRADELAEAFAAECPELAAQLGAAGPGTVALVGVVTGIVRHEDAFWRLGDGRIAAVLHHLRRAVFTHRLTEGELARGAIDLCPDLVALALPRSVHLADGTELRVVGSTEDPRASEDGSIVGPAGWLGGFSAGDLVGVRYDGEHAQIDPAASLDAAAAGTVAEALGQTFEGLAGERALEVHRLVVDTIGAYPASFAVAVAPVAELLSAADLGVRDQWVGPADLAWPTPPEQARRRRVNELLAGAEGCCRRAANGALEAWLGWLRTTGEGAAAELDAEAAAALADDVGHGPVAAVLADVAGLGRPMVGVRRLGAWAGEIAAASDKTVAGVEFLRALGADAAGDALGAEAHLNAGLGATPDNADCLGFLAELVADRGDARRSLALLRQAGRPVPVEVARRLEPFLVDRNVGRNDPCPCGSGRKYKVCCLRGTLKLPLAQRGRWLLERAARHALRMDPFAASSLGQLFDISGGGLSGPGGAETMALVQDMMLFADRGLARYLDGRGPLLAADELACAQAWIGCPLRLVEIEAANAAGLVAAVDLRSGERLDISDRGLGTSSTVGDTVLVRPLPVDDEWLLTGVSVPIPAGGRGRALATLDGEVRPFQLLQLLVDLQVDAIGEGGPATLGLPKLL